MKDDRLPEEFFDYNEITEEHKEAAREIFKYLEDRGAADKTITSRLKVNFGIEESKQHTIGESKIYQLVKQYGLFYKTNGHLTAEDGSHVPILYIETDIHRWDAFLEFCRIVMNEQEEYEKGLESTEE